jgi:hypothetical protein
MKTQFPRTGSCQNGTVAAPVPEIDYFRAYDYGV